MSVDYDTSDDPFDPDEEFSEEDYFDVVTCNICNGEFEVGLGEDPENCPLCGAFLD